MRLSNISWWMRLLCQRVAQRANHEEEVRCASESCGSEMPELQSSAELLSPLTIDEQSDAIGPCASQNSERCRDKGFLAMSVEDYWELPSSAPRPRAIRDILTRQIQDQFGERRCSEP